MRVAKLCAGMVAFIVWFQPAAASEVFICNDGRTLEVTKANREKLKNDPCVAEWFAKNTKKAPAQTIEKGQKTAGSRSGSRPNQYYDSWQSNPSYSYHYSGYTPYGYAD